MRRTVCPGLRGLFEVRRLSVWCEKWVMFCEARLSMDCICVKELPKE